MKLGTYLNTKGIPVARFAALIPVSFQAVHRYMDGTRIPRRSVMEKIVELTDGEVQPGDFFASRQEKDAA